MRFLVLLTLVACGAPPKTPCTRTSGCGVGETCNVNTGLCVGGTGGGSGGGVGGGGGAATVVVRLDFGVTTCVESACDGDCSITDCSPLRQVAVGEYAEWKKARYASCAFTEATGQNVIDCRTNCVTTDEMCTNAGHAVVPRRKVVCSAPYGTTSSCGWTP